MPSVPEIAKDPEFSPKEITKEEIEKIWSDRYYLQMSVMEQLLVKPIELTDDTILLPQPVYDAEELIVYVRNPRFNHISSYVNISGGRVIMGLDERNVLGDIEFNTWRSKWTEDENLALPSTYNFAGLEFTHIHERSNEFDLPVLERTNRSRSIVCFSWGVRQVDLSGSWVALSDSCFAFIVESEFVSFLVKLA